MVKLIDEASTLQREFLYININNIFVKKGKKQRCDLADVLRLNAS